MARISFMARGLFCYGPLTHDTAGRKTILWALEAYYFGTLSATPTK